MTDELLYTKLATHIGQTGSPLPVLHGGHVGFLGVVYPILLAPFYGSLDPVAAFDAAHIVNAVLFASTAIPVFLLARRIVPAECALVVGLLSIVIPWAATTGAAMSEAAAYPTFAWAVLACHGAAAEPSPRRDALAIGALALAFFTRPQFLFLTAVLPLAAVLVDGPRRALERHRVLAGAVVLGVVVVVPLAALGQAHRLLGDYGVTATEGSLLPSGVWKSAALHIDSVAVGLGVIPFVLGAGWAYSSLRLDSRPARAFAALAAVTLPFLALETASYDLRFGGFMRDRYVFYAAPLLLLGSAAALNGRLPLVGVAAATGFFAATVSLEDFQPVAGYWNDSPVAVINGIIHDLSPGLPAGVFVALCSVAIGGLSIALAWAPRPLAMLAVTVLLFAFCGGVTGYAFHRLLSSRTSSGVPVTGQQRVRDWVDRVDGGRSVVVLAHPIARVWGASAIVWWDVEFWNKTVTHAYVGPNGHFTYTPFVDRVLRIDEKTGVVAGSKKWPKFILAAEADSRFAFAGDQVAANTGLTLLRAERPYRARWATRGLEPDGWTRPGRTAWIRVFAERDNPTESVTVSVALDAPPEAEATTGYRVGGVSGSVAPGARAVVDLAVCVPAGGHADVPLRSERAATIAGPPFGPALGPLREVGVVVHSVETSPTGEACTP